VTAAHTNAARSPRPFATTRWSLVFAAGGKNAPTSPSARQALAELCEIYWYPLYAYVRRRGSSREEAEDLTQEFFTRLLEKETLQAADPKRGRFRSFLLSAMSNFLSNEWRSRQTQKRGGGQRTLSFDLDEGHARYSLEPAGGQSPEREFDRRWAMTLLERSIANLRERYRGDGKEALFAALAPGLGGGESVSYAEIGERLAMSEAAIKTAMHRLRRRCREALRAEIAQTVSSEAEIDDELRDLFAAVES